MSLSAPLAVAQVMETKNLSSDRYRFGIFFGALKDPALGDVLFDWGAFGRYSPVIPALVAVQQFLENQSGGWTVVATKGLFPAANELKAEMKIADEIDESLLGEFARWCSSIHRISFVHGQRTCSVEFDLRIAALILDFLICFSSSLVLSR
jgi:hypothetical protein